MAKRLFRVHGEVKTPPFSTGARVTAGALIRRLQDGESLSMPHSRPLPVVGKGCHELRVSDGPVEWRLVYATREDAIVLLDVFRKKTQKTPSSRIRECAARIKRFDEAREGG